MKLKRYYLFALFFFIAIIFNQYFPSPVWSQTANPGLGAGYVVNVETIQLEGVSGFGIVQEIPSGLHDIVSVFRKNGRANLKHYRTLLKSVEEDLNKRSGDDILTFERGVLLYMVGDYGEARTVLEKLIPRTPDRSIREEAAFHLGLIAYKQKKYEDSVFSFKDCLWYNPHRANAHVNLGIASLALQKNDEAASHFAKAFEIDAKSEVALFYLGYLAYEKGDKEKVRYYMISNGKMIEPENEIFVDWSRKLEKEDSQLRQLEKQYQLTPTDGELNLRLSEAFLRVGDKEKSKFHAEKALQILPQYWASYSQMSAILFYEKKYKEALEFVEKAVQLNPENLELQIWRGSLHIFMKDLDQAEEILLEVIEKDGDNLVAHAVLGQVYCFKKDLGKAVQEHEKCVALKGQHIEVEELAMRVSRLKNGYPDSW